METYRHKPLTSKPKTWKNLSYDNQNMINHCLECTRKDCTGGCMDLCELWQLPIIEQAELIEKVKHYLLQGLPYKEIEQRCRISNGTLCSIVSHRIPDVVKEFRKNQKQQKKGKQKCMKCRFSCQVYNDSHGGLMVCDYMSIMGHRRPCKGGLDCTVMEPRKRGRKKKGAH